MPSAQEIQCHAILSAAATATFGLVVRTSNPAKARQTLYNFRKEFADPTFDDIQVRTSPDDPEKEIWLLRRKTAAAPIIAFGDIL